MNEAEIKSEIQTIGESVGKHAEMHFKQWKTGLTFKTVFNKYSLKCKKLGLDPMLLSLELVDKGFIKLSISPSGRRYIFPNTPELSEESMTTIVLDQESTAEIEKENKKMRGL